MRLKNFTTRRNNNSRFIKLRYALCQYGGCNLIILQAKEYMEQSLGIRHKLVMNSEVEYKNVKSQESKVDLEQNTHSIANMYNIYGNIILDQGNFISDAIEKRSHKETSLNYKRKAFSIVKSLDDNHSDLLPLSISIAEIALSLGPSE